MIRQARWLIVAAVSVLPACQAAASAPDAGPSLLSVSKLVAKTTGWYGARFRCTLGPLWLSDTQVLHSRFTGRYNPEVLETRFNLRRTAYVLDTRTGRDTRLPGLTRALASLEPEIVDSDAVSPDGKWLLWSERWGHCLLASVRGTARYTYPEDDDGCYRQVLWLRDSRRWLEVFRNGRHVHHVRLHDVRRPRRWRTIPVAGRQGRLADIDIVLSLGRAIGLAGPDRDLGVSAPNRVAVVTEVGIVPSTPVRPIAVVPVPPGATP
jgi:hypothetical protein